jgi:hypothetical protein
MFNWLGGLTPEQLTSWLSFADWAGIILTSILLLIGAGRIMLAKEKDKRDGNDKITMQQRIEHASTLADESVTKLAASEQTLIQTQEALKTTANDATHALNQEKATKEELASVNTRMKAIATLQMEFELYASKPISQTSYVVLLHSSIALNDYPEKGRITTLNFEGTSAVATPSNLPYGLHTACTKYHFVLDYVNTDDSYYSKTGTPDNKLTTIAGRDVSVLNHLSMFHMDMPSLKKVLDSADAHEFIDMRVKLVVNGHAMTLFALQNWHGEVLEKGIDWRVFDWKRSMQDIYLSFDQ